MAKNTRWGTVDCETDAFDGQAVRPFVWAICLSDGFRHVFWDTAEFVEYLQNDTDGGILFAHNGGKFDWLMPGIIEHLEMGDIKIINSRLAKAHLGPWELRDSFLCLPSALAKFGGKLDFDYSRLLRANEHLRLTANKQKIEEYILADVVSLFTPMEIFINKYGFALTQAGAALKTWEKMGGEKRRYGKTHDDIFRPYYFGGRCQVFEYGAPLRGSFELFDIVSSYPRAMCADHPCGVDYYCSSDYLNAPGASFWKIRALSSGAFARRGKNCTEFPRGVIDDFYVTGWELNAALELGVCEIYSAEGLIPRRTETLKPYIDKYFAEKQLAEENKDQAGREMAKIFLNSLYGKFGSNPENYYDYKIIKAGELFAPNPLFGGRKYAGWENHLLAGEYDIIKKPSDNPQYYDVALAASVTGYARAALLRAIKSSTRPLYCDTDSLLCEKFSGGEIGADLGNWKSEGKVVAAYIAGKKLYAFNVGDGKYKTAHKGVSSKDIDVEQIIKVCKGEVVEIKRSAPSIKINGSQVFIDRKLKIT